MSVEWRDSHRSDYNSYCGTGWSAGQPISPGRTATQQCRAAGRVTAPHPQYLIQTDQTLERRARCVDHFPLVAPPCGGNAGRAGLVCGLHYTWAAFHSTRCHTAPPPTHATCTQSLDSVAEDMLLGSASKDSRVGDCAGCLY